MTTATISLGSGLPRDRFCPAPASLVKFRGVVLDLDAGQGSEVGGVDVPSASEFFNRH